jgi:transcriptional regulator with XRE-family HTH domain
LFTPIVKFQHLAKKIVGGNMGLSIWLKNCEEKNMDLSTWLKKFRKDRSVSLNKITSMTGVYDSILSNIEHGLNNPSLLTIARLFNGLQNYGFPVMSEIENIWSIELPQKASSQGNDLLLNQDIITFLNLYIKNPMRTFELISDMINYINQPHDYSKEDEEKFSDDYARIRFMNFFSEPGEDYPIYLSSPYSIVKLIEDNNIITTSLSYPQKITKLLLEQNYENDGAITWLDAGAYLRISRNEKNTKKFSELGQISEGAINRVERGLGPLIRIDQVLKIDHVINANGMFFGLCWEAAKNFNLIEDYKNETILAPLNKNYKIMEAKFKLSEILIKCFRYNQLILNIYPAEWKLHSSWITQFREKISK